MGNHQNSFETTAAHNGLPFPTTATDASAWGEAGRSHQRFNGHSVTPKTTTPIPPFFPVPPPFALDCYPISRNGRK